MVNLLAFIFAVLTFISGLQGKLFNNVTSQIMENSPLQILSYLYCNDTKSMLNEFAESGVSFDLYDIRVEQEIKRFFQFKPYQFHVILDTSCQSAKKLIELGSEYHYFNASYRWIMIGSDLNSTIQLLAGEDINVDSSIKLVIQSGQGTVREVYKLRSPSVRRGAALEAIKIDENEHKSPVLNYDLENISLVLGGMIPKVPKDVTFIDYIEGIGYGHLDGQLRCAYRFSQIFADMFNFTINIKRADSSGYLIPNTSNWNGIVGMMQRHEIDFSNAAMVYSLPRHPHVDSGLAASKFRQFFIFRHPKASQVRNVFLEPLDYTVWCSILCVSAIAILIFYIINLNERHYSDDNRTPFISSVFMVISAFSQQGTSDQITSFTSRISFLFYLIMSFFCFQFYSAQIVGSLLAPEPLTITSLKKLSDSKLKLILEDAPTSTPMFNISNNEEAIDMYLKRIKGQEVFMNSVEEGMLKVREGGYAFFTFIDYAYDLVKQMFAFSEMDDLVEIQIFRKDQSENIYLPIQKHSPFKEPIRVGMLKITEVGIKDYWMKYWTAKKPKGDLNEWVAAEVDFARFSTLFYFMCIAILFSFIIFLIEIVVSKENCLCVEREKKK